MGKDKDKLITELIPQLIIDKKIGSLDILLPHCSNQKIKEIIKIHFGHELDIKPHTIIKGRKLIQLIATF